MAARRSRQWRQRRSPSATSTWCRPTTRPDSPIAHGLNEQRLTEQLDQIAEINADIAAAGHDFRILAGMEVDILEDGSLDLADHMLERLDVVVASVHSKLRMERKQMTERMLMAVASPHVDILGHCTGRMIGKRPPSEFDADYVFAACAQFGTAVEINCRPERLDPPRELLDVAIEYGCWFSIDTDAHATGQLEWQALGCDRAAERGVPIEKVVNTMAVDDLLAWTAGDVESAEPAMVMWDLGRMAAASPDLGALFDAGYAGLYDRLVASDSPDAEAFLEAFADFTFHYGCRGPNEWETRSPTWETEPDLALAAIDRMRLSDESAAPRKHNTDRADEREAIGAEIAAMLEGDPETQGQFLAALHSATVFMPGRERTKTNNIKLVQELRVRYNEFGRRRVADGTFHEPNDFGLLTRDELLESIDDPGKFTPLLAEREALIDEVLGLQEPFLFHGGRPDMASYPRRDAVEITEVDEGEVVHGVPGCPGVVTGIARVVLDSHDPTALAPGDILVAPITDPSWTPLFVPAAGVVVDVGAPLSHAIIVSRELGIPCVVSVTDATKRIPDGATIELNGDIGTVTILSMP